MKIDKNGFQICRGDGKNSLFDVSIDPFDSDFDKLALHFLEYAEQPNASGKRPAKNKITIWLSIDVAGRLAHDIRTDKIARLCRVGAKKAVAEGQKNFYPAFDAGPMGTGPKNGNEARARSFIISRAKKDGKAKDRYGKVRKQIRYALTASEGPGRTVGNGLILPNGRQTYISIPLNRDQLAEMGAMLEYGCMACVMKEWLIWMKPERKTQEGGHPYA
jgi:hypothetical protein